MKKLVRIQEYRIYEINSVTLTDKQAQEYEEDADAFLQKCSLEWEYVTEDDVTGDTKYELKEEGE